MTTTVTTEQLMTAIETAIEAGEWRVFDPATTTPDYLAEN